ncbi:hypothetical protein ON010_g12124 [Phytophthora cinnamomi]|nr:hypothetical protein ON010_g12124 [Phytophthora cinnamomi]
MSYHAKEIGCHIGAETYTIKVLLKALRAFATAQRIGSSLGALAADGLVLHQDGIRDYVLADAITEARSWASLQTQRVSSRGRGVDAPTRGDWRLGSSSSPRIWFRF